MNNQSEGFVSANWRLLATEPLAYDGATNMAIDEAILLAIAAGQSPPTLRFYTWEPPCVSIGYAQSMELVVNFDACRRDGVTWVRRPTGGRAILHTDELTYSLTAPASEKRVLGGVVASYRRLSEGLLAGLRLLGLEDVQAKVMKEGNTGRSARDSRQDLSSACFDIPSHYEITSCGKKLVGSAQVRRQNVVLQHGAIPLAGDVTRLVSYLRLSDEERTVLRAKLERRAITLKEAMGRTVPAKEAIKALTQGFAGALNLRLERGTLTPQEWATAQQLREEKYTDAGWNLRK